MCCRRPCAIILPPARWGSQRCRPSAPVAQDGTSGCSQTQPSPLKMQFRVRVGEHCVCCAAAEGCCDPRELRVQDCLAQNAALRRNVHVRTNCNLLIFGVA